MKQFAVMLFLCVLPAWCSNKGSSGEGRNGRIFLVIVLDAFEPLQVYNTKHGQRQADPKEYQTHIEPPAGKNRVRKREDVIEDGKLICWDLLKLFNYKWWS